ncbi:hypothetical protein COEREDRAFT_6184 [Coemansia reversa NRRL 1564]|uniref:AB hydrolase-1 domain-containing protein n=1 Tax=Coemansia reversa (strain ATCC 12441 / NRRL 1564) TaxID=763665 RepID=A0A2G5BJ14_COERN|nr:hypothetical protein COEREDRAFT_6184 [Coemansia reversa NRRL 1564]|eukprot:PIA19024.1 hypothetical protein COEREDRAFT_6184 [Coemansia reversa NRRL 1564]
MVVETFELSCFVPSRLDGRALEAVVTLAVDRSDQGDAAAETARASKAVVYLHPYPPLGGQLRNNVVHELACVLERRVGVSVAFNLRGAGRSEGRTSWTGASEQEDLRSVLDMLTARSLILHPRYHSQAECSALRTQMRARGLLFPHDDAASRLDTVPLPPVTSTLLCGYSYGAVIAAAIAADEYPLLAIDYAYVSFPYSVLWALVLQRRGWYLQRLVDTICNAAAAYASQHAVVTLSRPHVHIPQMLFIAGSADGFSSANTYERWWEQLRACALQFVQAQQPSVDPDMAAAAVSYALAVVLVPNANHGWLRRECDVSDAVVSWWGPLQGSQ